MDNLELPELPEFEEADLEFLFDPPPPFETGQAPLQSDQCWDERPCSVLFQDRAGVGAGLAIINSVGPESPTTILEQDRNATFSNSTSTSNSQDGILSQGSQGPLEPCQASEPSFSRMLTIPESGLSFQIVDSSHISSNEASGDARLVPRHPLREGISNSPLASRLARLIANIEGRAEASRNLNDVEEQVHPVGTGLGAAFWEDLAAPTRNGEAARLICHGTSNQGHFSLTSEGAGNHPPPKFPLVSAAVSTEDSQSSAAHSFLEGQKPLPRASFSASFSSELEGSGVFGLLHAPSTWGSVTAAAAGQLRWLMAQAHSVKGMSGESFRVGDWVLRRVVQPRALKRGGTKRGVGPGCTVLYELQPPVLSTPALDPAMMPPPPVDPGFKKRVKEKLLALAEGYASGQQDTVRSLSRKLQKISSAEGNATQKLAHYLMLAMEARWGGLLTPSDAMVRAMAPARRIDWSKVDTSAIVSHSSSYVFVEVACLYTTIRALMGSRRVHIIVFHKPSILYWPALFRALANQPFSPVAHVTVVSVVLDGIAASGDAGHATMFADELKEEARKVGLELRYEAVKMAVVHSHPGLVKTEDDEAVAVLASGMMMFPDKSVLKHNPRDGILKWIHSLHPKCFILVEMDANFNEPFILPRVQEVLARTSALLESTENSVPCGGLFKGLVEIGFSIAIVNSIACDGLSRFWRSERLEQWSERLDRLGFKTQAFPKECWTAFSQVSVMESKVKVIKQGDAARLVWAGTPLMFALSFTA